MIDVIETGAVVLGGGPAGLAAASSCAEAGVAPLVIEREERLGGILKQCIHDGFGLVRYKEKLTGPEYALRDRARARAAGVPAMLETFVSSARRTDDGFSLHCVNRGGVHEVRCRSLVLATGCRERTDRQVFIHGDRPAGVYTAGLAQYMVNVQGLLPGRRVVILGSGDIGLIMARRLTLEGVEVEGVYEIKPEPSGLTRNVRQCLHDFGIPLHLSATVTAVHGRGRVKGVTVADVDDRLRPLPGTERDVPCDTLVLSVGLIPENELAASLDVPIDPVTRGPRVDQNMHTLADGVFACGNAVHVNDLVDYVSESGDAAGRSAARWATGDARPRTLVPVKAGAGFLSAVPQFVDISGGGQATFFFRTNAVLPDGALVSAAVDAGAGAGEPTGARANAAADGTQASATGRALFSRRYRSLRPPEMERFTVDAGAVGDDADAIVLTLDRKEAGRG